MANARARTELLLVGATGFVGSHVLSVVQADFDVTAVRFGSAPVAGACRWIQAPDEPSAFRDLVERLAPRHVVNAAALASIVRCEEDRDAANRVNVVLPTMLAAGAARAGARLIHLSTDQVFDGRRGPYAEEDPVSPISHYGATKFLGETHVRMALEDAVIVRLNLMFGRARGPRPSSSDRMIATARDGRDVPFFTDEYRSPLSVIDAASAVRELLDSDFRGVLHLGGPERLSRYDLGRAILDRVGLRDRARPATSASYRGPARAPDTSFDCSLAKSLLARPPRPLAEAVESVA